MQDTEVQSHLPEKGKSTRRDSETIELKLACGHRGDSRLRDNETLSDQYTRRDSNPQPSVPKAWCLVFNVTRLDGRKCFAGFRLRRDGTNRRPARHWHSLAPIGTLWIPYRARYRATCTIMLFGANCFVRRSNPRPRSAFSPGSSSKMTSTCLSSLGRESHIGFCPGSVYEIRTGPAAVAHNS